MSGFMEGRRVVVVGGASGIGRATAALCAREGAKVAVLDREAWTAGPDVSPDFAGLSDVRDASAVDAGMAAAAHALGGVDALVSCAGVDLLAKLAETRDDEWLRLIDINLTGAMRVCRAALPYLAKEGATIVLVSSAAGLRPLADRTAYCASKAGLNMFAKSLAVELAPRVRVNAICPGAIETPLFRSSFAGAADEAAARQSIRDRYALQRIAEPEEIASAIAFLSSAASSYVTGVALAADGGRSFH